MPNAQLNRTVVALLRDDLCAFELGIVTEVFGLRRPEMDLDWYRLMTAAETPGLLRVEGGFQIVVENGIEKLSEAGSIVVPGWRMDGETPSTELRHALLEAHRRGARIISICSGAFLLASCGLLDGLRATTHWLYADRLKELFPRVRVDAEVLYVDEGQVLTSAGSAAGIDLLLHIVRSDFGPKTANEIARRIVVPPHREGGQAQYIVNPVLPRANSALGALFESIRSRPTEDWTVKRMAKQAALSERTLIRRFREVTGLPPGDWVVAARVEAARNLLETESVDLEKVAYASGFNSAAMLRHHFRARVGVSPSAYRAQFSYDKMPAT